MLTVWYVGDVLLRNLCYKHTRLFIWGQVGLHAPCSLVLGLCKVDSNLTLCREGIVKQDMLLAIWWSELYLLLHHISTVADMDNRYFPLIDANTLVYAVVILWRFHLLFVHWPMCMIWFLSQMWTNIRVFFIVVLATCSSWQRVTPPKNLMSFILLVLYYSSQLTLEISFDLPSAPLPPSLFYFS